ncbi:hydrogenase maturation protease [Antrihabitans cavernicola]|uniref:Hydrogenase maturation protease n=1 Tax=Antrihabitans cavernicola TaxID=2495913 RepID=A0A5A7S8F4_9NOCA|nr:hydrogenase maturation protease [Spelaeibacter cavernicola]KAA0022206.1 hydrogenase maturation protease [Spelaeibacter cavernicola]
MSDLRVLVAGIGNIFLSDDGFGPEVLRRMAITPVPERVRIADFGIRGLHLAYELLDGCETLILIDAIPNRGNPGTVHVFEADTGASKSGQFDAHSMDPGAVLASVRTLGGTMPRTIVVGCEVETVDDGIGLSTAVTAAVPAAVDAVTRTLHALLEPVRTES